MRRTAPARSKHAPGANGSAAAASGTLRTRRHCSPPKTCRSRRGTGRSRGFAYNGISDRVVPLHRIALLQIPLESRLRRTIAASSPSSGPARHPISPGLLLFSKTILAHRRCRRCGIRAAAALARETTNRRSRLRTMRFALSYMRNGRVRANALGAAMQASQGLRYLGGCGEVNTRARPSRLLSTTRPKRECPAWGDFAKYRR